MEKAMKDMARKICDSKKSSFPTTPSIKPKPAKKMERRPQRPTTTASAVTVSDDGKHFKNTLYNVHTYC